MKLPSPSEYQMALHAPDIAFVDPTLRRSVPVRNPLGLPSPNSGGFALTFSVKLNGHRYAIRCFHREGKHLRERYTQVAAFVRDTKLGFLVDVEYQPSGIRVGDDTYPIVRMSWVDGLRLDEWISDNLHQRDALEVVRHNISDAVSGLRRHKAAHGDLQHGNVLVLRDLSVRLVDYDGMYLPGLRGYGAAERGHRNYQHPGRVDQYDESLDQFSAAIIDLSLAALRFEPGLWAEFARDSGESLLFSAEDLLNPSASRLFDRLDRIPAVAEQARRLRRACGVAYDAVPAALAGAAVQASATHHQPRSGTGQAPVLRADDRFALLAHEGDQVTVVGRVQRVKTFTEYDNKTFINFGNYRLGAFTIVAWERGGRDLRRAVGNPVNLEDSWVAVTGLLTVYRKRPSATPTPQIELHSARMLRTITASEAAKLLAEARQASRGRTAPSAGAPAGTAGSATGSTSTRTGQGSATTQQVGRPGDLTDRLGRLYSSPTFAGLGQTTQAQKTTAQPTPPPPPTKPRPPKQQPPKQQPPKPQPPKQQPPPHRRGPQYVVTHPYTPHQPPVTQTGLTVLGPMALVLALCFPPLGFGLALYVLVDGNRRSDADRVCSSIALCIVGLWLVFCCAQMVIGAFTGDAPPG